MKVAIFALLAVCLFASSIDNYVNLVGKESCAGKVVTTLQSEIEAVSAKASGMSEQAEILSIISKGKQMMDSCPQETYSPANADIIEKDGIALLLGSNCEKDAGIMLLLGDTIVKDPKNYANDAIVLIFEGILGRQAIKECEQFIHYVHPHH